MRKNFSSPTLSPLPPDPSSFLRKEVQVLPKTAPPSPDLTVVDNSVTPRGRDNMRATHIRPRTAPASPERPGTAYSTRSTIRQVQPSPDSLNEAFANGFADGGTPEPVPERTFEPFPPFDSTQDEDAPPEEDHGTHIPSTEPIIPTGALRRGGTPSERSPSRKSRSCSPQKSRSRSPRKHIVRTPTLPAHQESPSSVYSAEQWDAPDTPSPISQEQQREAYAPLRIRRPLLKAKSEGAPAQDHRTQAKISEYMQKMRGQQQKQRGGTSKAPDAHVSKGEDEASEPAKGVVPAVPHIVSAMIQSSDPKLVLSPFSAAQRRAKQEQEQEKKLENEKEPARHTSVSRRSETSGASVASRHSIFSTPGRDEMERKKPIVEEDEGPFAKATGMQDLEQRRRRVSEGTRDGEAKGVVRTLCGTRCVVM